MAVGTPYPSKFFFPEFWLLSQRGGLSRRTKKHKTNQSQVADQHGVWTRQPRGWRGISGLPDREERSCQLPQAGSQHGSDHRRVLRSGVCGGVLQSDLTALILPVSPTRCTIDSDPICASAGEAVIYPAANQLFRRGFQSGARIHQASLRWGWLGQRPQSSVLTWLILTTGGAQRSGSGSL